MFWIVALCVVVGTYLIGSFPSGYLAGRSRGVDLRKEGSGNVGATNALRVLGKKLGYLVFAADIFKGWLAVRLAMLLASLYAPEHEITFGIVGAFFTVVGHNYPIWLGFQGGKGIATSGGIMLGLFPIEVFCSGLAAWMILFFTTRYVSVASIAAAIALPVSSAMLAIYGKCDWPRVTVAAVLCLLALWRHRPNIQRLWNGTEKRFEKKGKKAEN